METSRGSSPGLLTPWPDAIVTSKERTTSTMDDARELARAGCPTGTVAAADYQEKGRGRVSGRTWISPPGESLLATVVLRIPELGYPLPELPLRAGVAVALGIEDAAGISVEIKWPNDVVAPRGVPEAGRKLAGLLCETHGDAALVGFGVNCAQSFFPDEISRTACSLLQLTGRRPPVPALLSSILARLKAAPLLEKWQEVMRARLHRRGEAVHVDLLGSGRTLSGTLLDIDDRGRLVLELSDGRRETVEQGELLTSP
jgi:BirA family biotin operon repressor/biotin-[acetyl-CoA-carboxylase] ligase